MVNPALQSAVVAVSLGERSELVEYIDSTVESEPVEVTDEQQAMIRSRAAELRRTRRSGWPGTSWTPEWVSLEVTRRQIIVHPEVEMDLGAIMAHYAELDPPGCGRHVDNGVRNSPTREVCTPFIFRFPATGIGLSAPTSRPL